MLEKAGLPQTLSVGQLSLTPTCRWHVKAITGNVQDIVSPPYSICVDTLPTDARVAPKERLAKMKELGIKPKKKAIHVEEGTDDCGDNISGLGKDISIFS